MQVVSSAFTNAAKSSARNLSYGVLISWTKAINAAFNFFTIGTSTIGGADILKSTGAAGVAFFDKYQYDNFTAYLVNMAVIRNIGDLPWGMVVAQADLELNNTSRKFLPGFDAVIGNFIQPRRPVKLALGFNGETVQQFVGFTGAPENNIKDRKTTLHAFDAFDHINSITSLTTPLQVNQYTTQIIATLLQEAGFNTNQYVLDQSLIPPIPYYACFQNNMGVMLNELCEAEQATLFVDENGIIRLWNRQHLASATPVATFDYSTLDDAEPVTTPIINDVIVTAKIPVLQQKQKVYDLQTPQLIQPGASLVFQADFQNIVAVLDALVYQPSSSTSYYLANTASDNSGSDGAAAITVTALTHYGKSALITFTNSSATTPYYVTTMALYGTPVFTSEVVTKRVTDATSVGLNGINPANSGTPLAISTNNAIQDTGVANTLATTIVTECKNALRKQTVKTFSRPELQFGDMIAVTSGDTDETKNLLLLSTKNTLGTRGIVTQELTGFERVIAKFFNVGGSKVGGTDPIAP